MYVFQSMLNVTMYITITVFILIFFATNRNPLAAAGMLLQDLLTAPKILLHLTTVIGILFLNNLELSIEKTLQIQSDFTSAIYSIDGDIVAVLQNSLNNDTLTYITSFFYVVIFPSLMLASIGIYIFQRNHKLFYALCYAILINYIVAFPFYLFFPVREVWSFLPNVHLLITDVFPTFEKEYRPMSGLDNCFPSLHTSISVTLAVLAAKSGIKRWSIFVTMSTGIIIFSIFYLGIHWFTDMCGGLILGFIAARIALRISEGKSWRLPVRNNENEVTRD